MQVENLGMYIRMALPPQELRPQLSSDDSEGQVTIIPQRPFYDWSIHETLVMLNNSNYRRFRLLARMYEACKTNDMKKALKVMMDDLGALPSDSSKLAVVIESVILFNHCRYNSIEVQRMYFASLN